jgi:hypothetical protein
MAKKPLVTVTTVATLGARQREAFHSTLSAAGFLSFFFFFFFNKLGMDVLGNGQECVFGEDFLPFEHAHAHTQKGKQQLCPTE